MNTIEFADTGVQVSELCLGTMMFGNRCDEAESDRILSAAMDAGVTFIDTAAGYVGGETESILGRIMQGRRDKLFIGTKVTKSTDAAWIRRSLDESLARLQTGSVDLFMIHWPRRQMNVPAMMAALNDAVQAGKVRFIGCCNFPAWLFAHCNTVAQENGWAKLVNNQIPYNLLERGVEVEVLPQAIAEKIAITVYRPLLMGVLAGKYSPGSPIPEDSRGFSDKRVADWLARYGDGISAFNQFAADRGLHPAQLAVAWVRKSAGVSNPIAGVSSLNQLQASIDAMSVDLSDDEYGELTGLFDCSSQRGIWRQLRAAPAGNRPGGILS